MGATENEHTAGETAVAELRETREQLAATSEILAILAASPGAPNEVFGAIVDSARRLCRSDAASLYLLDDDRIYHLSKAVGLSDTSIAYMADHPMPLDRDTLAGRVGLDRQAQQIEDVVADPEYGRLDLQRVAGFRTTMGAPLVVNDEVVGALVLWRNEVRPFAEREMSIVAAFAGQAALAINEVRLVQQLQAGRAELARRVDQLEALSQVGDAVSSSLDADEVLATIVNHAVELSGTDGGSLVDLDEETGLFSVRTATGTSADVLQAMRDSRIHIDETLIGRACRERAPVQVEDLATAELDPHLSILYAAGWRSVVAVPLIRSEKIVGALVVRRKTPGAFSDETCDLLEAFATQSAIALTNARIHRQLEVQSAELAEASRHKSEFLASMSHELRTPLNAVIGFSEVLLERMFGEINERQEDYLRDILSSGRHLLALLNDVLDLSKVEAGQMELDRTDFPVEVAITYALSMVRERALDHHIALRTEISPGLGLLNADELRFRQVLLNLLSNAVKFTADGGSVVVAATRLPDSLEVTVSDTGIGIAPADQERIFDSFQQGTRSARTVEGTGLGLTLTRRIVELHGGRVWVRSELAHGSTFGFSLPAAVLEPVDAALTSERHSAQTDEGDRARSDRGQASGEGSNERGRGEDGRPTAVIIEDDPNSAELLSLHLEAAGLRTVVLSDGRAGLRAVREMHPDVVVLDIRLPGMDGWDVLTEIKSDPVVAATPVIVVSVLPNRSRGIALGASDYLVKPVAHDDLFEALRRLVPVRTERSGRQVAVMVDDDLVAIELARLALEPAGWSLRTCTQADEVFRLVRESRPSVVLVDLVMADMDGFEVIDRLRGDPVTTSVPIVVLTSKTLTAADRRTLEGRIEFVTSKNAVDMGLLAKRLSEVPLPTRSPGGAAR
ncbi:MAG: response regulator [Knoellia sp.]